MKIKQKRLQEIINEEVERFEKNGNYAALSEMVSVMGSDFVLNEMINNLSKDELQKIVEKLGEKTKIKQLPQIGNKVRHLL